MRQLTEQQVDYLASSAFVCCEAARILFHRIRTQLEANIEAEAATSAQFRALKKYNKAAAKEVLANSKRKMFSQEQRFFLKNMLRHIQDLERDFDKIGDIAISDVNTQTRAHGTAAIYDAYAESGQDLVRLVLLWANFQYAQDKNDQGNNAILMLESYLKQQTPTQQFPSDIIEEFRLNK